MRHQRLSRAEEKAYALPAKLSLPMMVCIFPVVFVVILLPVYVKLHLANLKRRNPSTTEGFRGTEPDEAFVNHHALA